MRVERVERPERREVVADARDRHAVDRHRQIDTVEGARVDSTPYGMTLPLVRLTRSRPRVPT